MEPRINTLLAVLPETEYDRLTRHMSLVSLCQGQTLFDIGDIPEHVYYPVGALVSMRIDMPDGYGMEVNMLGKTCMVGIGTVGEPSFYRAKVRETGLAYRMPASTLQRERLACPVYMQGAYAAIRRLLVQQAQTLVCAKRHSVDQQLIRWVLLTLDRTLAATISVTHQELAEMLGVRREAVTLAIGRLSEAGCVTTLRGEMEVLDRAGLEARACDCYWQGQEKVRPAQAHGLGQNPCGGTKHAMV